MPEQRVPDVSKFEHGNEKDREVYMIAFAAAINEFDYDRYQSALKLAAGNVCAAFERDGLSTVGVAHYLYKLDVAFWDIYFDVLGDDKPACPWITHPVQNDPNDEPSEAYIDWRSQRGLTGSMDVSGDAIVAEESDSRDPMSLIPLLKLSNRQATDMANAATEQAMKNIEMLKSVEKLRDENEMLQQKVERLEEEARMGTFQGNDVITFGRS
ncbi:uncharacterized protein FFB20_14447 [Fusarium fujikuroi]|uniref:Uncharacterized protein n=1 Tax=Gibberella fujikuroi (strain CBS 195.34 / IMI 58289 / NRRL A-6831) TaxID=1279085 RepID=S0EEX4_GIBF5|nr:uncharacterized protein FFUJ_09050 [Fusarium fujikuroi IMI 58289]KLO99181.1 uncharacterized protein Y057_7587 [Fusarium fujikuroi]KLP21977.1 uncharacterized protein LW94_7125 [Fusarium fujikuroi]CCT70923.1 uncharacterized protein FFUJ_09050 [Fusarium fujikuroi IMI 58289]SCO02667.1 uncharacterized protein FFM5_07933 [Fusarium fujikuroi]SCO14090.1 uncharacterized protein FFB20_14447 [Fusarium fujikuroi]